MSKRFSVARLDKGEMTSQGFLKVPATFTRTGVFNYLDKSGNLRRELRHPDDVFHPDSLKSLQMAPLTFHHPEKFVTVDNVKDLQTGYIGDGVTNQGGYVAGTVLVTDKKAIAEASKGTVELSCGYTADMLDEAGDYNGEAYDCRQTNIRYNHVAQVPAGRAGPMVRMHMDALDADDAVEVEDANREETRMKITIKGKEYEVDPAVGAYINDLSKNEDAAAEKAKFEKEAKDAKKVAEDSKKEADDAKKDAAEQKKSNDVLQAKLDSAEQKLSQRNDSAMTPEQVNQHVKNRMKIEKVASEVLGAEFKEDASDMDLMKAVLAKRGLKLDGKSEDYVKAGFDIALEDHGKRQDNHENLNRRFSAPRTDADFDVKTARDNQTKHDSEQWKTPLAASKK